MIHCRPAATADCLCIFCMHVFLHAAFDVHAAQLRFVLCWHQQVVHKIDSLTAHGKCWLQQVAPRGTMNVHLCCRPWARLSAYIAHGAAALASLWNVVDAAAIVQHFKSQDAAKVNDTDIEGCTANDTDGCTCNGSEAASESGDQEMTALVMLQ